MFFLSGFWFCSHEGAECHPIRQDILHDNLRNMVQLYGIMEVIGSLFRVSSLRYFVCLSVPYNRTQIFRLDRYSLI